MDYKNFIKAQDLQRKIEEISMIIESLKDDDFVFSVSSKNSGEICKIEFFHMADKETTKQIIQVLIQQHKKYTAEFKQL